MAAYEITGNIQKRFIENAVLLHLLDPVRGSPTANSLDRNADPGESRESVLKRKFLDSLALVASTHKNGDKVSAATLEEGAPDGTVVRVASNAGVCDSTLFRLQDLMSDLNEIAATGFRSAQRTEILIKIIRIDIHKIRHYLAELLKVRSKIADTERVLSRLALGFEPDEVQQFSSWISSFKAIAAVISADASPSQLLPHVIWAEKAKWEYSKYLDVAFSAQGSQPPRFIYSLYKLGRYAVASRALCQLASEFPALFCPMRIETVRPFPKVRFSLPNTERPLSRVLRRVIGEHEQEFATRMASVWNVGDPEARFRKACTLHLAVHAEMQLVNFYDQHPNVAPLFRFIGVSKKSCYLCHRFLLSHPSSYSVSSCHQKLYLSWRVPPSTGSKLYRIYKLIIKDMSKTMELVAKRDLNNRLGHYRSVPLDSTAGVSLSGLKDPIRSEGNTVVTRTSDSTDHSGSDDEIEGASLWENNAKSPSADDALPTTPQPASRNTQKSPSVVFNISRADNTDRRDLVSLDDITDSAKKPSWRMLIGILNSCNRSAVCFDEEKEFMAVGRCLRVENERQFHACLQFLRNEGLYNVDVIIRTYASLHGSSM